MKTIFKECGLDKASATNLYAAESGERIKGPGAFFLTLSFRVKRGLLRVNPPNIALQAVYE